MFNVSGTELVVLLVLSVVWAAVGYFLSEQARRANGRTPWGLPSPVWALLWFLSLLLGLVLYLIAQASDARRARRMASTPPGTWGGPSQFPSYPTPANSGPSGPGDSTPWSAGDQGHPGPGGPGGPGHQGPGGPGHQGPGEQVHPVSPPAWHPDPSGRYQYRWWDGSQWTSQVATNGHHLVDTHPDQRIGPY